MDTQREMPRKTVCTCCAAVAAAARWHHRWNENVIFVPMPLKNTLGNCLGTFYDYLFFSGRRCICRKKISKSGGGAPIQATAKESFWRMAIDGDACCLLTLPILHENASQRKQQRNWLKNLEKNVALRFPPSLRSTTGYTISPI